MLRSIEINHELFKKRIKDKLANNLKNGTQYIRYFYQENQNHLQKQTHHPPAVPIKQYSNKFLRQSNTDLGSKQNQKKYSHVRLNSIIKKHKAFQKKYNKIISKREFVCRTEPNQTEYQCFMTFTNLEKATHFRAKTQSLAPNQQLNQSFFDRIVKKSAQLSNSIQGNCQTIRKVPQTLGTCGQGPKTGQESQKRKAQCGITQQKISTSRALQIYSKVIGKQKKAEKSEKPKLSNQHKSIKQKILESTKNLEARHIVLFEKERKYSVPDKPDKVLPIKTSNRQKIKLNPSLNPFAKQDDSFELNGWQAVN